jgi:hypothetical protein
MPALVTYSERALALTLGTSSGLDFLVLVLDERAENVAALVTVVLYDGELRQHAGGGRHDTAGADQLQDEDGTWISLQWNWVGHRPESKLWAFTTLVKRPSPNGPDFLSYLV